MSQKLESPPMPQAQALFILAAIAAAPAAVVIGLAVFLNWGR